MQTFLYEVRDNHTKITRTVDVRAKDESEAECKIRTAFPNKERYTVTPVDHEYEDYKT